MGKKKEKLLDRNESPTCLHVLGQPLVDQLWREGRALRKRLQKHESGKLWAIVSEKAMCGDSAFYCPTSRVPYKDGMTIVKIKEEYIQHLMAVDGDKREDAEEMAEDLEVAWVLNERMISMLEMSAPECGNDSAVYTVNRTMKGMAKILAIKEIK